MTFLAYNEQENDDASQSIVGDFRKTLFYKALVKHTQSGNRRLVQSMLTGSNLMEADDEASRLEQANNMLQQAMEAVGSGHALDVLTKLVSSGFDRSLLDIQLEDKKGEVATVFLSDKASKFKESIRDILSGCCSIEEMQQDNGMLMLRCAAKEGHEPGAHAAEVAQELPSQ